MSRIVTTVSAIIFAMMIMGGFQLVSPHDGLIAFGGKAFAADMATKAPIMAPAPVGKGKAPIGKGKGKAPVVTRG